MAETLLGRRQLLLAGIEATNTQPCAVWRRMIPSCGSTENVCAPEARLTLTPFVPGL